MLESGMDMLVLRFVWGQARGLKSAKIRTKSQVSSQDITPLKSPRGCLQRHKKGFSPLSHHIEMKLRMVFSQVAVQGEEQLEGNFASPHAKLEDGSIQRNLFKHYKAFG